MDTHKLAQMITQKSANVVYHSFNNESACIDDCRAIIRGMFELATEEERAEIMRSMVKYDYRKEFESMMEA